MFPKRRLALFGQALSESSLYSEWLNTALPSHLSSIEMNLPSPTVPDSFSTSEFDEAFAIAKQALGFVGRFQTPPTPEIFELWYRYVEGKNEPLNERMAFLVNEAQSANRNQIESLRSQFLVAPPSESHSRTADDLIASMAGIESLIRSQKAAGSEFDASLNSANDVLGGEAPSAEEIKGCVQDVLASNSRMQLQLEAMKQRLDESQGQIHRLRLNLNQSQRLLMTDPLTGIGNRRFFDSAISQAVNRSPRGDKLMFLLLVDLDNFKSVNDTYGHDSGDTVIQFVASELKNASTDAALARYGGDEFAIFLEVSEQTEGKDLADRIVAAINQKKLKLTKTGAVVGQLSVSVGAAVLRPDDTSASWFERADKLLYSAKTSGRNTVMVERKID